MILIDGNPDWLQGFDGSLDMSQIETAWQGLDPALIEARRISITAAWADPALRQEQSLRIKSTFDAPGRRKRASAAQYQRYSDPAERAKTGAASKRVANSPEGKARASRLMTERWAKYRAAKTAGLL